VKPLLLLFALSGCATKGSTSIDPTPSWATEGGRVSAKIELAEALLLNGTPEAALQMISQMSEAGVRHPDLFVLQGRALTDMGLVEEAETALSQATRRSPTHAEAHNRLGILFMDQQRTEDAIKRFRMAARNASTDAEIHNNYGFALMAAGRHAEAVTVLRKALMLNGAQARTRNNLGFALVITGQDKAAWRVLRSSTNEENARYNLALAQELRGDNAAAIASYKRALKADPDFEEATSAIARLTGSPVKPVESTVEDD
jgi:Flp pilus assembly protein TadD